MKEKNKNRPKLKKKIDIEIVQLLYSESITNLIVVSTIIFLVAGILYHKVLTINLLVWIFFNVSILLLRIILIILYKNNITKKFEKKTSGLLLNITIYLNGLFIGLSSILIFPDDIKLRIFLIFVIGGLIIGVIGNYAIKLRIVFIEIFLLSIPLITRLIIEKTNDSIIMAGSSILFIIVMILNSIKINKSLKKALLMKFKNVNLIKKISQERKQAIKLKKEAQVANKSKSIFLANISHEIRTPMNAVIGFADLLAQTNLTTHQQKYLRKIKESSNLLLHIINQILDYSNVNSRNFTIVNKKTNIKSILEETKSIMDIIAKEKSINIKLQIDDNIPQIIISDPLRIKQILINLINNAIKFTKQGQIIIKCNLNENDNNIIISVKDSGVGIEKHQLKKLFKRFSQLDSQDKKYHGTGLGLAISKSIVTSLGGKINVKSEVGQGSEFYFSIPINLPKKNYENNNREENSLNTQELNTDLGKDIKILIAEDNQVNRELIELLLNKKGWLNDSVNDGKEVLEVIKNKKYDLILMDIQMPNMDGIEATKIIREQEINTNEHIPILAFTAMGHIRRMEEYLSIGMDGYISKPVNAQKLYVKIHKILKENLQN